MREQKFRAWSIEYEEYIEDVIHDGSSWLEAHGYDYVNVSEIFDGDEFIVEQCTGLKDKNGKEIYEGDIVFFFTEHFDKATGGFDGEDEHNAIVEWFDNGFAFMDKVPYDPNIECEVIGNIHENGELLKEEQ